MRVIEFQKPARRLDPALRRRGSRDEFLELGFEVEFAAGLKPRPLHHEPLVEGRRYVDQIVEEVGAVRVFKHIDPAIGGVEPNPVSFALELPTSARLV